MNILILCLLIITIILLVILIIIFSFNKKQNTITSKDLEQNKKEILDNLSLDKQALNFNNALFNQQKSINEELNKNLQQITFNFLKFKDDINKFLDQKIDLINNSLKESIDESFKKTNESFNKMLVSISEIKSAQNNLEKTQSSLISLQEILQDKKSRGTFGEVSLNSILYNVFGENQINAPYEIQHKFNKDNQVVIADAIVKCPSPVNSICIDSKFPLENYKKMIQYPENSIERKNYSKLFENDVSKKIVDIANKYIIPGVTSNQAIMFLPSEAIFAEINANYYSLIEKGQKYNVWLASPTTLMAFLTTVSTLLQNIKYSKNILIIKENIEKLSLEFERYKTRWSNIMKHLDQVSLDVKDISTTTEKISKKFEEIKINPQNKIED